MAHRYGPGWLAMSKVIVQKSDNLQYNTLGCMVDGSMRRSSDVPSIIFFHNFLKNSVIHTELDSAQISTELDNI